MGVEGVRLRDFLDRFQKAALIREAKDCRAPSGRTVSIDAVGAAARPRFGVQPEARRHAVLETPGSPSPCRGAMRFDSS